MINTVNDRQMRLDWVLILLMFVINSRFTFAFQDIYEPDDSSEQAHLIILEDDARQQHTLHYSRDTDGNDIKDTDWFKFYAITGKRYGIEVDPVGTDINVAIELHDSNGHIWTEDEGFKGEQESTSWTAPDDNVYLIKITDASLKWPSCRTNIQYELRLRDLAAPTIYGRIKTTLIDALSGQLISAEKGGVFYTIQEGTEFGPVPSGYVLKPPVGANDLIGQAAGYQSLTCPIDVIEDVGLHDPTQIDMLLLPHETKIPAPLPSKTIYHPGETLHIEFPGSLPAYHCLHYYFGIAYPDGRFFIIPAKNQLELLTPPVLPHWKAVSETSHSVLIDKPIETNMPLGEYQLYTLRLPKNIQDPINHLEQGELNVGQFRIESE